MAKWTRDKVVGVLSGIGSTFTEKPLTNGTQFVVEDEDKGIRLNMYTTGTLQIQGKENETKSNLEKAFNVNPSQIRTLSGNPEGRTLPAASQAAISIASNLDKKVFIVYGHDDVARNDLELLLLRLDIKPVILSNITSPGKTIIEALYDNSDVHYAIALLTNDDIGSSKSNTANLKGRARQNVILELGMFLMKLGRDHVAILLCEDIERPSDIDGLIYIPFRTKPSEAKNKIASALQKAGFHISIDALSAE